MLLIVDNTFYTPVLQRPIELGADLVIHSATKYLGGHNDLLAGLVVAKGEELSEEMFQHQNAIGAVLSPFDSWLLMRGLKTLALRMRQHQENARELAAFWKSRRKLPMFFIREKAACCHSAFKRRMGQSVSKNLKTICFAESLGGVESFITYPATQTHMDIPEDIRIANGVCNRLLRFSVGIEHVSDLKQDLKAALEK